MSSTSVIRALKKWWWAVVALIIGGGLAGGAVSLIIAPTYESTAQIVVAYDAPVGAGSSELVQANTFAVQKINAYQQIAVSPRVLNEVIASLGLDETTQTLAQDITIEVALNTPLMSITASAGTPQDALAIADAMLDSFTGVIVALETPSGGGVAPVRIEPLQEPELPIEPATPDVLVNIAIGLAVGLVAAAVWIVVAATSDRRIHSAATVATSAATSKRRVLGSVPSTSSSPLAAVLDQPRGRVAEAYRTVAATLGHTPGAQLGIIAIAPATPRDSTSSLSVNIALAMEEFGVRTALVDANLRSGSISKSLGLSGPGLSECLRGSATLEAVMGSVGGVAVLPAGKTVESPAELMSGVGFRDVLKQLKTRYDMILIDTAPVLPLSDTIFAASAADSTVLAVSAGRVTDTELAAAADTLSAVGVDVVGIVVMDAPVHGVDADASTSLYRDLRPAKR